MFAQKFIFVFLICVLGFLTGYGQSPNTDTIPELPPPSEVPVDTVSNLNDPWLSDTTFQTKKHSPRRATIYSTILPGLGQVYNRQYYKVPILAGAGIFFAILISSNNFDLGQANSNYKIRQATDINYSRGDTLLTADQYDVYDARHPHFVQGRSREYSTDNLRIIRDGYRRDRDFFIIMSALVYALNIVDAAAFAHLREFELNNKISMKIDPDIRFVKGYAMPVTGLTVSLNFSNNY